MNASNGMINDSYRDSKSVVKLTLETLLRLFELQARPMRFQSYEIEEKGFLLKTCPTKRKIEILKTCQYRKVNVTIASPSIAVVAHLGSYSQLGLCQVYHPIC